MAKSAGLQRLISPSPHHDTKELTKINKRAFLEPYIFIKHSCLLKMSYRRSVICIGVGLWVITSGYIPSGDAASYNVSWSPTVSFFYCGHKYLIHILCNENSFVGFCEFLGGMVSRWRAMSLQIWHPGSRAEQSGISSKVKHTLTCLFE